MEGFIIFSNTYGGRTLVNKDDIIAIHEDDVEGEVTVVTTDQEYMTSESFDSIISKLAE